MDYEEICRTKNCDRLLCCLDCFNNSLLAVFSEGRRDRGIRFTVCTYHPPICHLDPLPSDGTQECEMEMDLVPCVWLDGSSADMRDIFSGTFPDNRPAQFAGSDVRDRIPWEFPARDCSRTIDFFLEKQTEIDHVGSVRRKREFGPVPELSFCASVNSG